MTCLQLQTSPLCWRRPDTAIVPSTTETEAIHVASFGYERKRQRIKLVRKRVRCHLNNSVSARRQSLPASLDIAEPDISILFGSKVVTRSDRAVRQMYKQRYLGPHALFAFRVIGYVVETVHEVWVDACAVRTGYQMVQRTSGVFLMPVLAKLMNLAMHVANFLNIHELLPPAIGVMA
jgi:hypothetical protein